MVPGDPRHCQCMGPATKYLRNNADGKRLCLFTMYIIHVRARREVGIFEKHANVEVDGGLLS